MTSLLGVTSVCPQTIEENERIRRHIRGDEFLHRLFTHGEVPDEADVAAVRDVEELQDIVNAFSRYVRETGLVPNMAATAQQAAGDE